MRADVNLVRESHQKQKYMEFSGLDSPGVRHAVRTGSGGLPLTLLSKEEWQRDGRTRLLFKVV